MLKVNNQVVCHGCGCKEAEFMPEENHVECPMCLGYSESLDFGLDNVSLAMRQAAFEWDVLMGSEDKSDSVFNYGPKAPYTIITVRTSFRHINDALNNW